MNVTADVPSRGGAAVRIQWGVLACSSRSFSTSCLGRAAVGICGLVGAGENFKVPREKARQRARGRDALENDLDYRRDRRGQERTADTPDHAEEYQRHQHRNGMQ